MKIGITTDATLAASRTVNARCAMRTKQSERKPTSG
jgi:hypothetical protein